MNKKKGLLVVSFGTSYAYTREMSIEAIERDLSAAFPEYTFYRAWTSKMIIRKLQTEDQLHIDTVPEAIDRMIQDGITDLLVQPTHILNGIENDIMKEEILAQADSFTSVSFGDPLLTTTEDTFAVMNTLAEEFSYLSEEEALVLVGHGTSHYANMIYPALNYIAQQMGHPNFYIGTVEGYPEIDSVIRSVKAHPYKKVTVTPLMIVAGDHANNDICGDDEDSWASRLRSEGFATDPIVQGLGEYSKIRELLISHAKQAEKNLR